MNSLRALFSLTSLNRPQFFTCSKLFNKFYVNYGNCYISNNAKCLSTKPNEKYTGYKKQNTEIFISNENLHAYDILKNTKEFNETILPILQKASNDDDFDCLWNSDFLLSPYNSEDQSINIFLERLPTMRANDIVRLQMHLLSLVPSTQNQLEWQRFYLNTNLHKIWTTLDVASSNLIASADAPLKQSSCNEMLAISSLWFELGLQRHINFNQLLAQRFLNSLGIDQNQPDRLTFTYLMFLLNLNRSVNETHLPSMISLVELYLNSSNTITWEDLSLISLAFFKTRTIMPSPLLKKFINLCTKIVSNESNHITADFSLASILKMIRFSLKTEAINPYTFGNEIKHFLDVIFKNKSYRERVCKSNFTLTHLLLLLDSSAVPNYENLYQMALDQLASDLQRFRIKDVERMLFCLANVNFPCPQKRLSAIEHELVKWKDTEIQDFPSVMLNIVQHLLVLNYYPNLLFELILKKGFLPPVIEPLMYNTCLILDTVLRMNGKSLLTDAQLAQFRGTDSSLITDTKKARFLESIGGILSKRYPTNFQFIHLLPFSKYPFPVIRSENDYIPENKTQMSNAQPFCPEHLKGNHFNGSIVFMVITYSDHIYGRNKVRGFVHFQRRLLSQLGFKVMLVPLKNYPEFAISVHKREQNRAKIHNLSNAFLKTVEKFMQS